jgi:hypothetical protein
MSAGNKGQISKVLAKRVAGSETLAQQYSVLVLGVLFVAERIRHLEFDLKLIVRREQRKVDLSAAVCVD